MEDLAYQRLVVERDSYRQQYNAAADELLSVKRELAKTREERDIAERCAIRLRSQLDAALDEQVRAEQACHERRESETHATYLVHQLRSVGLL